MRYPMPHMAASLFAAFFMFAPVLLHGQQPAKTEHEQHHPVTADQPTPAPATGQASMKGMMATMRANDQRLDDLLKQIKSAEGTVRVDAIVELLTALVKERRTMHESMSNMPMMMHIPGRAGGPHGSGDTGTPRH